MWIFAFYVLSSAYNSPLFVGRLAHPLKFEGVNAAEWKTVFNAHGLMKSSDDTFILITDKDIVVQLPEKAETTAYIDVALNALNNLGFKDITVTSWKFTSFYSYSYLDEKNMPAIAVVEAAHGGNERFATGDSPVDHPIKKPTAPMPPILNAKDSDSSVVIMFNSNSAGWAAIDSLHQVYAGQYVDLSFTSRISERISDLRSIRPEYIIIVADPTDLTPDFMYDADTTSRVIDDDPYHDAVLSFVTGFGEAEATQLASAENSTNSNVLVIANPDGSLQPSGYIGIWLTNYLENDVNHLGDERLYVNTTSLSDPDITASNIASELNNLHRGNIFFEDHGWPYGWVLRGYDGGRANDVVAGWYSDLKTWTDSDGDGYADTPYDVENGQNSFVFADACITARINGARATAWEPWETSGSNMSPTPSSNIALAWMKDSPGFYIGSNSVSYGSAFMKFVLLGVTHDDLSPAQALTFGKNIYNYIIGRETSDSDPSDGTADDLLEYLRHEFVGFGKPTWMPALSAGTSPDYTASVSAMEQQDQLPDNDRGYVYAGTPLKWQATVNFSVNEELTHEPWSDAAKDSMPFTYVFVRDVGGNGSSVWGGICALIASEIAPGRGLPDEVDSIDFVSGDPGDPNYHFYEHPWYGPGSSEAYEIFKAAINYPNELIMMLAAGVTDADNDGDYEWRINSGYTKSFDIYAFTPPVSEVVEDTVSLGDDRWKQTVVVSNEFNSSDVSEVIVRVPVSDSLIAVDSVNPSGLIHDVVVIPDSTKGYNIEFTVSSIPGLAADTFEVFYTVAPSDINEPENPSADRPLSMNALLNGEEVNIELSLASRKTVHIRVYDVSGREVARLFDGELAKGLHRFTWQPKRSGVYTVMAGLSNGMTLSRKVLVLR